MDLIVRGRASNAVELNLEVVASLDKGSVGGVGNDPSEGISTSTGTHDLRGASTHISGSVTPRSVYAFCRAARQAMMMDSVPPLVVTPAPSEGALNSSRTWMTYVS